MIFFHHYYYYYIQDLSTIIHAHDGFPFLRIFYMQGTLESCCYKGFCCSVV